MLITRRWRHLVWLPVYAFSVALLSLSTYLWFYTHDFYLAKRLICELLFLVAVAEVLRKEAKKEPLWIYLALFGLVVVPFMPMDRWMLYYLPQMIFSIGLASELPTALRTKSAPLLGFAVLGVATAASDILKLMKPIDEVIVLLRYLDPLAFSAMLLILFYGLFRREVEKWVLPPILALKKIGSHPINIRFRKQTEDGKSIGVWFETGTNVVPFHRPKQKDNTLDRIFAVETKVEEVYSRLAELEKMVDDKILVLEECVKIALEKAVKFKKVFLSPMDLAIYLGTSEELARKFVEFHGISRLCLSHDNTDDWLVFRADVDDVIEDAELEGLDVEDPN